MKKHNSRPVVIRALKSKAHLVRQVAIEQGISFDETTEDDVIRFSFKPMDDDSSRRLALAIPREAFARRAVVGGGPQLRISKKAP